MPSVTHRTPNHRRTVRPRQAAAPTPETAASACRRWERTAWGRQTIPTYVKPEKCDGCQAQERPACMYICPMNLMKLDPVIGKSYNHEPDLCWECYSCVKTCPQSAIEMRGGADYFPMGAMLTPLRGTESITWTARYRNGDVKRFKFPIRTTPWGSIEPHPDHDRPRDSDLKAPSLFGEDNHLGIDRLPVPASSQPSGPTTK